MKAGDAFRIEVYPAEKEKDASNGEVDHLCEHVEEMVEERHAREFPCVFAGGDQMVLIDANYTDSQSPWPAREKRLHPEKYFSDFGLAAMQAMPRCSFTIQPAHPAILSSDRCLEFLTLKPAA